MIAISNLPMINAALNSISAALLTAGYLMVRRRRIEAHRKCMIAAFAVSALFLTSYLVYHYHAGRIVHILIQDTLQTAAF